MRKGNRSLEEKEKIRNSLKVTKERRKNQILKVFEVKVNCHNLSKESFQKFNSWFTETKWIQNDMISSDDIFKYNYKDHRTIRNFDKNYNLVERKLTIQTAIHQETCYLTS